MTRSWIAVASAEHVKLGREAGFMQVCHGKGGPLARLGAGDRVAYYSPTLTFRARDKCRAFTAIGTVRDERVYQADMGDGFMPFRRDVDWWLADAAPIYLLLERLECTRGRRNWGYVFRFGLLSVSEGDMDLIAGAMQAIPSSSAGPADTIRRALALGHGHAAQRRRRSGIGREERFERELGERDVDGRAEHRDGAEE